jgi:hypothetical protein
MSYNHRTCNLLIKLEKRLRFWPLTKTRKSSRGTLHHCKVKEKTLGKRCVGQPSRANWTPNPRNLEKLGRDVNLEHTVKLMWLKVPFIGYTRSEKRPENSVWGNCSTWVWPEETNFMTKHPLNCVIVCNYLRKKATSLCTKIAFLNLGTGYQN